MKPLILIYWLRLALGVVAGLISAFVATVSNEASITAFLNGVTTSLAVYLLSYYILKAKYASKVEKPNKIMTMGIFMYFLAWAVFFILFYSFLRPPSV